jgi:Lsr2
MNQETIGLRDDIDGTEATQRVTFSLEGTYYQIDLSTENVVQLRSDLDRYIKAATEVTRLGRAKKTRTGPDPISVREWAHKNGVKVSARGRISNTTINNYLEAVSESYVTNELADELSTF